MPRRDDAAQPLLRHGVGLASGTFSYGNIGSRERLDFMAIGSTVNLASRIEGLTKEVGRTVLCTREIGQQSGLEMASVGSFALKGIAQPVELFTTALAHGARDFPSLEPT